METDYCHVFGQDTTHITGKHKTKTNICIKPELEQTQDAKNIRKFDGSELEGLIKVENKSENDGNLGAKGIATSELVNESQIIDSSQKDEKLIVLEKIPKSETEILGDDETPVPCDGDKDVNYNIDTYDSDCESNSDPECDPFADVDCDPRFSLRPARGSTSNHNTTLIHSINSDHVNHHTSILPTSPESVLQMHDGERIKTKTSDSKLQCQLCLEKQCSEKNIKTHVEICAAAGQDKNLRRFCVPCNKLFCSPTIYRRHALTIHGIKEALRHPYALQCEFCSRTFAYKETLATHTKLYHGSHHTLPQDWEDDSNPRPFKCPECTSTFTKATGLTTHRLHVHKNMRRFKCQEPNCGRAFNVGSQLKTHVIRAHTDETPFTCAEPNCGKVFKLKSLLQRHMAFHSVERPFKCPHPDCSKMFASKVYARAHLPAHTGSRSYKNISRDGSFACEQCEQTFYKRYMLNRHLRTIHYINVEGSIKCPITNCKSTFKYNANLKLHIANIHTNQDNL